MGLTLRIISEFGRQIGGHVGRHARGSALAAAALVAPAGGAEAGFFDFLFNPPPPAQSQAPRYPGGMARPWHPHAIFHARNHKALALHHRPGAVEKMRHAKLSHGEHSHAAVAHAAPDLMDDDSLQNGDAVMTENGLRIFIGDGGDRHKPEDFAELSETKGLSGRLRTALAAIDANRSERGGSASRDSDIVTGRSAALSGVSAGAWITDPRGRKIRYVGP